MNLAERLTWLFAGLFLLRGVPLVFLDKDNPDPGAAHTPAVMAALFLGVFALFLADGRHQVQHFNFYRTGQPRRFTATVAMIFLAGCGTLLAAFWFLLVKQ